MNQSAVLWYLWVQCPDVSGSLQGFYSGALATVRPHHMLWSIDKTGYLLTSITWPYRGLRCRPIEVEYVFEVISWQVTSFEMMAGSSLVFLIHMKYVVFYMCRTIKILFSNWPRKLKFSQCLQAGKTCQLLLTFLTKVTRWSRSTSNFYALIGQNLTGEFMRKMYAASWNLFT